MAEAILWSGANPPIEAFTGPYFFLSNFYLVHVTLDGERYASVEHAYQAAKTTDPIQRRVIQQAQTPGVAKRCGRTVTLRDGWELMKENAMRALLAKKFTYPVLRQALLDTDTAMLVEGNWWGDRYWGIYRGQGRNRLGVLLMELRVSLRRDA